MSYLPLHKVLHYVIDCVDRSVQTVKGYRPPYDVEERIKRAVSNLYGSSPDWKDMKLDNRRTKFNVSTTCTSYKC